ncbi:N(6)-adenine-specific DNA methyltransferase 2 [Phytophthora megakarya]|uniref:N(6)-adenine-specific DNA methyltransferase 2 n=1 Tax=Phytophthora megakarya TaxID=4795 RepID=A0A225X424_9STRA|nr:N(6)-adenine-specific DNA methyltransferase 2 [Phytophthora megakarya]
MEPATKKVASNWYDEKVGRALAQEAIDHSSIELKIAFMSTLAAYRDFLNIQRETKNESMGDNVYIFEYEKYGDGFCFYNYNAPTDQPENFHHFFDYGLMEPRCRAAWSIFVRAWISHT